MQKPAASVVIDLTGTELPDSAVEAVIDDAALMVEKCIKGASGERQAAIIKWVAAHLIASGPDKEVALQSQKLGDATDTYFTGKLGTGLSGSPFGAQALALDDTGCLARLGKPRATLGVI